MVDDQALAALDRVGEGLLVVVGPDALLGTLGRVAIVQQQHVILREVVRGEVLRRRLGHVHLVPRLRRQLLQEGGGLLPVVAVVTGDDQHLHGRFVLGAAGRGDERQRQQTDQAQPQFPHESLLLGGWRTSVGYILALDRSDARSASARLASRRN